MTTERHPSSSMPRSPGAASTAREATEDGRGPTRRGHTPHDTAGSLGSALPAVRPGLRLVAHDTAGSLGSALPAVRPGLRLVAHDTAGSLGSALPAVRP